MTHLFALNRLLVLFLTTLLVSVGGLLPAAGAGSPPGELSEIESILQDGLVPEAGSPLLNQGSVEDLLRAAQGRILLAVAAKQMPALPMAIEVLPDNLVYFRLRSFTPASDWDTFATQADQALAQVPAGVVLDVRSNCGPDDFAGAAQLLNLFLSPGSTLYSIRKAKGDAQVFASQSMGRHHIFTGPVVLLIDHQTAGAAEAFAAVLQTHGAVTMGGTTSGNGALFASHTLASGMVLRYVAGEVTMGDGTPLWRHAVQPDVGIPVDEKKAAAAMDLLDQGRLPDLVQESPGSHRLSESALVQGYDPELDAYLPSPHGSNAAASLLQDSVLVAALDSLKAIRLSHAAPASGATPGLPSGSPR